MGLQTERAGGRDGAFHGGHQRAREGHYHRPGAGRRRRGAGGERRGRTRRDGGGVSGQLDVEGWSLSRFSKTLTPGRGCPIPPRGALGEVSAGGSSRQVHPTARVCGLPPDLISRTGTTLTAGGRIGLDFAEAYFDYLLYERCREGLIRGETDHSVWGVVRSEVFL